MKRVLMLLATVPAFAVAMPAMAQSANTTTDASVRAAAEVRPAVDLDAFASRLRDRGVAESDIEASLARIRYWLSLGASPARIRNFLQSQQGGDTPERPDVSRPDASRADVARPEVADIARVDRRNITPTIASRGVVVQRSDTAVRPSVATPRSVRPAVTRPLTGN